MRSAERDMKIVEKMEQEAAAIRHAPGNVSERVIMEYLDLAAALRHWIERAREASAEALSWEMKVPVRVRYELDLKDQKIQRLEEGLRRIATRYAPSDPNGMAAMMIREAKAYLNDDDRT